MKAWEASVFGQTIPDGAVCCLCDQPMPNKEVGGRRWAQSFPFNGKWICGSCSDEIYEIQNER